MVDGAAGDGWLDVACSKCAVALAPRTARFSHDGEPLCDRCHDLEAAADAQAEARRQAAPSVTATEASPKPGAIDVLGGATLGAWIGGTAGGITGLRYVSYLFAHAQGAATAAVLIAPFAIALIALLGVVCWGALGALAGVALSGALRARPAWAPGLRIALAIALVIAALATAFSVPPETFGRL